jgi:hypothetical protein
VLAAVLVGAAAVVMTYYFTRETPLNHLQQQIRGEVPVGSTREQVEAWAKQRLGKSLHIANLPADEAIGNTLPEAAGVPRADLAQTADVEISAGWYTTPYGEVAPNKVWVIFTLNENGQVTGHYFLTLEELAAIEQKRLKARSE